MQERHQNPQHYFEESKTSCQKYYIPYVQQHVSFSLDASCRVLEIGCGLGGNLAAFALMGCEVAGVDIHGPSIEHARELFKENGLKGTFTCADIYAYEDEEKGYDLILLHDSLEHIPEKERLLTKVRGLLKDKGVAYFAFPAWRMPFGGHQQVARKKFVAKCPYIHLLPTPLFKGVLRMVGEPEANINDFLDIKSTRISINQFNQLVVRTKFQELHHQLYLINPHYEAKFGMKPRILPKAIAAIPYFRDFFSTSCHFLLVKDAR